MSQVHAIKCLGNYVGVPSQGHANCSDGIKGQAVQVQFEPMIVLSRCFVCGEFLLNGETLGQLAKEFSSGLTLPQGEGE